MKKVLLSFFLIFSIISFSYENKETINGITYTFKYEKAPSRVVSVSNFMTEIMLKLGLKEKIVGTALIEEEIYPEVVEDYKQINIISSQWPSFEQILVLNPDFITGWEVALKKGVDSRLLRKNNINMFIPKSPVKLDADLDTLFEDYRELGKIFRIEKKVDELIKSDKLRVENIKSKLKNKGYFTYFLYDSGNEKAFTNFKGFTTNLISILNAKNIVADTDINKAWGETSWESILEANPDYIIIIDYSKNIKDNRDSSMKINKLKENPITKNLRAVKNDKFIIVKLAEICPGIRNIDFLERIFDEIYGEK